ncbi:uncharacterized protein LOC129601111 [Paramacrobiotus metropolitanus]|uniref:uncharacterized protein LOC129601111 n=1 Tax=Paramacrobiotus metropolitanus TaxID=2943436 RepID=UPI002446290D|nr:uncharacterized protein LOC129601111 [Paramacrobiotus metropolitanus]XP_055355813.1 uncharacterized protein LOC129601111 [Paramacrobiotus metropolitanus]
MTALDMLHLVLSVVLVLQSSLPCPVKQAGLTRELINGHLDEAIRSAKNDIVHLKQSSISDPVEIRPADSIIRAPEGRTARIHCKGGKPVPAGQEERPQLWLNGRRLFVSKSESRSFEMHRCSCLVESAAARIHSNYSLIESNPVTGELITDLREFSHAHAGKYECVQYNGSDFLTTQTFFVSPTITASQIFRPPMPNVTVRVGGTARFPCYVKFLAMPGDFGDRFLWRNDDHVIYAKGFKEFQTGSSSLANLNADIHIATDRKCHCHSTLKISRVEARHAGRYQCWFRVDDVFHEWVVQEAYLIVNN